MCVLHMVHMDAFFSQYVYLIPRSVSGKAITAVRVCRTCFIHASHLRNKLKDFLCVCKPKAFFSGAVNHRDDFSTHRVCVQKFS